MTTETTDNERSMVEQSDDISPDDSPHVLYSISLSSKLASKIDQHIQSIKALYPGKMTRQKWFNNAIREKLRRYENGDWVPPVPRQLAVRLEKDLYEDISKSLDQILDISGKKVTKKSWIIEAIQEKLELDSQSLSSDVNISGKKQNRLEKTGNSAG